MAVSVSSMCDGASYVMTGITKYGREYEHTYVPIARKAQVHLDFMREILKDEQAYTANMLRSAFIGLRDKHFLLSTFFEGSVMEVLDDSFMSLETIYDDIDSIAEWLASEYVSVDAIKSWWQLARRQARKLVKLFQKELGKSPDLKIIHQAKLWRECFDVLFKEQLNEA